MKQQVVTITFFRYQSWRNRWWAFQQMGLASDTLGNIPGLQFFKMLGSGGKDGFGIWPNFGVYGLLGVWQNETRARQFFNESEAFQLFHARSEENWTIFMRAAMAHGQWDGQSPFELTTSFDPERPVAVITRATIYPRHLWRFWRFTPPVGRSITDQEGVIFYTGIGELPLIQQATFSLWKNSRLMQAFAYSSPRHKEVVRRTRELGWYKEELFARFHPFDAQGSWEGANPLVTYLAVTQKQ